MRLHESKCLRWLSGRALCRRWQQANQRTSGPQAWKHRYVDACCASCSASAHGAVVNMNVHVINMNAGAPSGKIHGVFQHAVPPDQETVQKSRDGCSGSQTPILYKFRAHDQIFPTLREVFVHKTLHWGPAVKPGTRSTLYIRRRCRLKAG